MSWKLKERDRMKATVIAKRDAPKGPERSAPMGRPLLPAPWYVSVSPKAWSRIGFSFPTNWHWTILSGLCVLVLQAEVE